MGKPGLSWGIDVVNYFGSIKIYEAKPAPWNISAYGKTIPMILPSWDYERKQIEPEMQ